MLTLSPNTTEMEVFTNEIYLMNENVNFGIPKHFSNMTNYTLNRAKLKLDQTFFYTLVVCAILFCNFNVLALKDPGSQLEQAGITTTLGAQIDLNLTLTDSEGKPRSLKSLISDEKPLILIPVYYKCPRLCGLVLGGVTQLVKDLDLKLGQDFSIATFSFNSVEGFELAAQKKAHYTSVLAESGKTMEGWDFFVGEADKTKTLINQLGFGIMPDGEEFAHSAAIFILDKSGRISQFFTDIDFPVKDVRLALVEASQGKIGNILDQAMLFCFRFDPTMGKYTWAVGRLMKVVGTLSILFVGGIIGWQIYKEKKRLT